MNSDMYSSIRQLFSSARLARDSATSGLLGLLIAQLQNGERAKKPRPINNDAVIAEIKALRTSAEACENAKEVEFWDSLLPKNAPASEVEETIDELIKSGCNSIPNLMKELNAMFETYDRGSACAYFNKSLKA